jgi:hypothetical protein
MRGKQNLKSFNLGKTHYFIYYSLLFFISLLAVAPCKDRELTPTPRLAPEGTLFVIKPFVISHESGVVGFKLGDKVKVVGEDSSALSISAKGIDFSQETDYFTNNLDALDALLRNAPISIPQSKPASSATPKVDKPLLNPRVEFLKNNLRIYQKEIIKMTTRIEKAADERESKYFYRYGGGRDNWNRNGTRRKMPATSLSVDASQIISLIKERTGLKNDVISNFSELSKIDPNAAKEYRELVDNLDYWYRDK